VTENALPEIDTLIHEPARLRPLALLAAVDRADFVWLLGQSGLSKGNLSTQMARLQGSGIVAIRKEFRDGRPRTTYRLTARGVRSLRRYRMAMSEILDALPR
jgi:DNA-binding transcriptional ArsR family regulator